MRFVPAVILILALTILAACGTTESAHGGGSENGSGARVRVGVPF